MHHKLLINKNSSNTDAREILPRKSTHDYSVWLGHRTWAPNTGGAG